MKSSELTVKVVRIVAVFIRVDGSGSSIAVLAGESWSVDQNGFDFDSSAGCVFSREEKIWMGPSASSMSRIFNLRIPTSKIIHSHLGPSIAFLSSFSSLRQF